MALTRKLMYTPRPTSSAIACRIRRLLPGCLWTLLLFVALISGIHPALAQHRNLHTDPLNLTPEVRQAHVLFYNLDYDNALSRFEAIERAHPQNPMATN